MAIVSMPIKQTLELRLPPEMLLAIFEHLDAFTMMSLAATSRVSWLLFDG